MVDSCYTALGDAIFKNCTTIAEIRDHIQPKLDSANDAVLCPDHATTPNFQALWYEAVLWIVYCTEDKGASREPSKDEPYMDLRRDFIDKVSEYHEWKKATDCILRWKNEWEKVDDKQNVDRLRSGRLKKKEDGRQKVSPLRRGRVMRKEDGGQKVNKLRSGRFKLRNKRSASPSVSSLEDDGGQECPASPPFPFLNYDCGPVDAACEKVNQRRSGRLRQKGVGFQ